MQREEALAIALDLLSDPSFGYYDGRGGKQPWSESALSRVISLLQSMVPPDGPEPPDTLERAVSALAKLPGWAVSAGEREQLRDICTRFLAVSGRPPRFVRKELRPVKTVFDLVLVLSYLRRLWKTRRTTRPIPKEIDPRWKALEVWRK
jgi:hypothetical protein